MGFRLTIKTADNEEFGDDHKLYGYWKYEEVINSFMVLYPLIKEQWPKLSDNSPESVYYTYFCAAGVTDELTVSNVVFEAFVKEYITDLIKTFHAPELVAIVALYLTKLAYKYPGDKILYWS